MTMMSDRGSDVMTHQRKMRPAADNNVQDVLTAMDGYRCGPIRALAQDPPQNSADAKDKGANVVTVDYQLLTRTNSAGEDVRILTITDAGTTGLDGPILSEDDLAQRELLEGQLVIEQGENWAAWEAMRYTKSGEDKLGSRGQGKYAYLFHSAHPAPGASQSPRHAWRMIILYDTLLKTGEYRLGVRCHNPSTKIADPPYVNDEARSIVKGSYKDPTFEVPLDLDPLAEPGTRVIIPFLSDEAWSAAHSSELVHWLEAQWWRKIQKGELVIRVTTEDGLTRTVGVPAVWDGAPWDSPDSRYFVQTDLPLPSDSANRRRRIKRVVLFSDDALKNTDQPGPAQMNGIQLLRGGQWITTIEMSKLSDWVPREHRAGVRGFVEFDRQLERELREIEDPAHDGFNTRKGIYQELERVIFDVVHDFARTRGWVDDPSAVPEPRFEDLVRELAVLFVEPDQGKTVTDDTRWSCSVDAKYPSDQAKANWGDGIQFEATCIRRPAVEDKGPDVAFSAFLIRPTGDRVPLGQRHQQLRARRGSSRSGATANFGDLTIEHPRGRPEALFQSAGRHSIEVVCRVSGQIVARGRCSFFVATELPPPPPRHVTLELVTRNVRDGSRAFDYGDELICKATVRNYWTESAQGELAVTIDGTPYVLIRESLHLPPAVLGDQAKSWTTSSPRLPVSTEESSQSDGHLRLGKGVHTIRASVDHDGLILATATNTIIVGDASTELSGELPFSVVEVPDALAARWDLQDPTHKRSSYVLEYSGENPVYLPLKEIGRPSKRSGRLPQADYLSEIIAEGIVEWSLRVYRSHGDEGKLRLVTAGIAATSKELAERFDDKLQRIISAHDDVGMHGRLQRELAAIMVEVARRSRT